MNYNYDSLKHKERTIEFQSGLEQLLERSLTELEFKKIAWLCGMGIETADVFIKMFVNCYNAGKNAVK